MIVAHFQPVQLDLDFDLFVTADYSCVADDSPVSHQKQNLSWLYEPYGGYPDSFVDLNTRLRQRWWGPSDVDYEDIGQQLNIDIVTVSSLRQEPGNVVPLHVDAFYRMKQLRPLDGRLPVRANICLQDADIGHMLQFVHNNEIVTSTSWTAGQGYRFDQSVPHLSCNAGMTTKYTLQVSGFLRS